MPNFTLFDNFLEGVQIIDNTYKYKYVNKSVADQGKKSIDELIGKSMMEVYPEIEKTEMFISLKKCMSEKIPQIMLNQFKFPDGSTGYFELRMEPIPEGVLILSMDITEKKRIELDLKILNERLEFLVLQRTKELVVALEKEKKLNEFKTNFVSIASHELKTPLTAIQLSVNVLEDNIKPEETEKEKELYFYQNIKLSVRSMFKTIEDFLSLDKLVFGKTNINLAEFDLKELIKSRIELINITCKPDQHILYKHHGKTKVNSDRQFISYIIGNLLSNAIKYSDKNVEIVTEVMDDSFKLTIKDQGIGIPTHEQNQIFTEYFRATNAATYSGTGLGLNIVKRYVDLLNGDIHYDSKENVGTTFEITIPTVQAQN